MEYVMMKPMFMNVILMVVIVVHPIQLWIFACSANVTVIIYSILIKRNFINFICVHYKNQFQRYVIGSIQSMLSNFSTSLIWWELKKCSYVIPFYKAIATMYIPTIKIQSVNLLCTKIWGPMTAEDVPILSNF